MAVGEWDARLCLSLVHDQEEDGPPREAPCSEEEIKLVTDEFQTLEENLMANLVENSGSVHELRWWLGSAMARLRVSDDHKQSKFMNLLVRKTGVDEVFARQLLTIIATTKPELLGHVLVARKQVLQKFFDDDEMVRQWFDSFERSSKYGVQATKGAAAISQYLFNGRHIEGLWDKIVWRGGDKAAHTPPVLAGKPQGFLGMDAPKTARALLDYTDFLDSPAFASAVGGGSLIQLDVRYFVGVVRDMLFGKSTIDREEAMDLLESFISKTPFSVLLQGVFSELTDDEIVDIISGLPAACVPPPPLSACFALTSTCEALKPLPVLKGKGYMKWHEPDRERLMALGSTSGETPSAAQLTPVEHMLLTQCDWSSTHELLLFTALASHRQAIVTLITNDDSERWAAVRSLLREPLCRGERRRVAVLWELLTKARRARDKRGELRVALLQSFIVEYLLRAEGGDREALTGRLGEAGIPFEEHWEEGQEGGAFQQRDYSEETSDKATIDSESSNSDYTGPVRVDALLARRCLTAKDREHDAEDPMAGFLEKKKKKKKKKKKQSKRKREDTGEEETPRKRPRAMMKRLEQSRSSGMFLGWRVVDGRRHHNGTATLLKMFTQNLTVGLSSVAAALADSVVIMTLGLR